MRQDRFTFACDAALAAVTWSYLAFAYVGLEHPSRHVPICPFFFVTGVTCPLCGSTRFIGELLHGVVNLNRFTVVWLLWFVVVVVLSTVSSARIANALRRSGNRRSVISNKVVPPTAVVVL